MPIIKVAIDGSDLLTLDIEEYVKGCLAAEMPANWNERALRAQARLIRTYGLAKMVERGFVYADTRDQVFDPSRRTPRTDAIVEATRGVVGVYKGKIIPTWYHASCGGETLDDWGKWLRIAKCPCGKEKHGHSRGMCQYGAQELAEKGWACQAILDFYYKDITWLGNYGRRKNVTKTSAHIQRIEAWMQQALIDLGCNWVKFVNPPGGSDPMPRISNKVVRIHTDAIDDQYVPRGEEGGRDFVRHMLPQWRERPWATCYSLANEPGCNSPEELRNLRLYSIGAMREASIHGIKLVILETSESNPTGGNPYDPEVKKAKLRELLPAVQVAGDLGHYVGVHAYWRPGVEGPLGEFHALGEILVKVLMWQELGLDLTHLQLLGTEWGLDGAIQSNPHEGWQIFVQRGVITAEGYVQDLARAEQLARQWPWLKGLFLFDWGFEGQWGSYDHDEGMARNIIRAIEPSLPAPPEPPPTNGPTDDEIRNLAWNALGVPYTPGHTFPVYAQEHNLGAPLRNTFDHQGVRIQPFMGGIVVCPIGQWQKTTHIKW